MTIEIVGDLYDKLRTYPSELSYLDKTKNEEKTVYWDENPGEIMAFFDNYETYIVENFEISARSKNGYEMYIRIRREEDGEDDDV